MRELRAIEIKTVTDESCLLVSAVEPLMNVLGYLAEVVKLNEPVVQRVADYRCDDDARFVLHQHELDGLPGIKLDTFDDDGPVWLRVDCLRKIEPPTIDSDLGAWIDVSADPDRAPSIRESVVVTVDGAEKDRLVEAKQARTVDLEPRDQSRPAALQYLQRAFAPCGQSWPCGPPRRVCRWAMDLVGAN